MLNREYVDLVEMLADRTAEGLVNWKTTTNENEFVVYFVEFSVSIRSGQDYEGNEFVVITLRDKAGKSIDTLSLDPNDPLWSRTNQLYGAARRKALRIDDALRHILGELSSASGPIGEEPQPPEDDDDDLPF